MRFNTATQLNILIIIIILADRVDFARYNFAFINVEESSSNLRDDSLIKIVVDFPINTSISLLFLKSFSFVTPVSNELWRETTRRRRKIRRDGLTTPAAAALALYRYL